MRKAKPLILNEKNQKSVTKQIDQEQNQSENNEADKQKNNKKIKKGKGQQKRITGKRLAFDGGIQLITPSEPARLPGSAGDSAGNQAPISGPELAHQAAENGVFLRRPRPFHSVSTRFLSAAGDTCLVAAPAAQGDVFGVSTAVDFRGNGESVVGFHGKWVWVWVCAQFLPDLTAKSVSSMERQLNRFIGHFFRDFPLCRFFLFFSFSFPPLSGFLQITDISFATLAQGVYGRLVF